MDRALYVSMTGAKHNMLAQAAHSHNLANVSTSGFKADFVGALTQQLESEGGLPTRAFATTHNEKTSFAPGSMQETGRDLDVAVDGPGWIAVLDENGEENYVRGGKLATDVFGSLRNEHGDEILGNVGPIVIPEAEKIEIGADGTISIRALGQGPQTLVELDRIRLVGAEPGELVKRENGKIYADGVVLKNDASVRLRKGFIENSNVNAVEELTSVVSHSRQFEMQVKLMQTVAQMSETQARLLQVQV